MVDRVAINRGNHAGNTALHLAAQAGHAAVVNTLLDFGADINQGNIFGDTALHLATHHGHIAVVNTLLNREAAIHQRTNRGENALLLSTRGGRKIVASNEYPDAIAEVLITFCHNDQHV